MTSGSKRLRGALHLLIDFLTGCVVAAAAVMYLGDWVWSLPAALSRPGRHLNRRGHMTCRNEKAGIQDSGLVDHEMVAGVRFELTTFGLCDLTQLSLRVGLYLHPA
jgi:hypothetical protein